MSENNILGRDPLETGRDSIWLKPKAPPVVPPPQPAVTPSSVNLEPDLSKVIQTDDPLMEKEVGLQVKEPVKAGPPLVSAPEPTSPVSPAEIKSMPEPALPAKKVNLPEEVEEDTIEETLQLIGFKLGAEFFGIGIINVQEIIRHQEITMVPRTPEFVGGVISLRGRVIPVINLRKRFGMETAEKTKETRIIIVELDSGTVGFTVDAVTEVTSLSKKTIDPAPPTATGINKEYIHGVGKLEDKLMIILDLNQVLSKETKEQIKHMAV